MQKKSNVFWGIFLLIMGALLIIGQIFNFTTFFNFGPYFNFSAVPFWAFAIAIVLIAIIVQSIVSRRFWNILLPLAMIYAIFQRFLGWFYISPWILIFAAVLLSIGFSIIFKRRPPSYHTEYHYKNNYDHTVFANTPYSENNENTPYVKSTFSGSSKYLRGPAIESGQFYNSFGELNLHLEQATLSPNGATFYVDCSFGATKLLVPKTWQVKDKLTSSFGTVQNNTQFSNPDPNLPTLILTGNVSFGALEIYYV